MTKEDYYMNMREVGLQEVAFEKKLKTFSKGMRQKVGLTIAIIKDAPNILLDEPTSALDALSKVAVAEHFYQSDQTVLWVSHDHTAFDKADRVITLDGVCQEEAAS